MARKPSKKTPQKAERDYRQYVIPLALVLLTLAVYWQVSHFEFTNYDDPIYVTKNEHVQAGLTADGISWAFSTNTAGNWHPLTWISLMADVSLARSMDRTSPNALAGLMHSTNLALHILSTLLLYLLLVRVTGSGWRSGLAAALFALHPLHVQSVAWVSERKDVLSTVFWMLTLLAYVWYARTLRSPHSTLRYCLLLLCLALGLMAKPMLVTLPLILLLLDFWPLHRWSDVSWNRLVVEKLPLLALAGASSAAAVWAQRATGTVTELTLLPLGVRLANASVAAVLYIGKVLWPANLAIYYPHPNRSLPVWEVVGSAALLLAVTALVVALRRRAPYLLAGWAWYVITLLPVIGLVQVGEQAMADRYTYVPLIGLFLMIAWAVPERPAAYSKLTAAGGLAVMMLLSFGTYQEIDHWRDSVSLWSHAVAVTRDNAVAESNLADALCKQERYEAALPHLERAIALRPRYALAQYGMGIALGNLLRWQEAVPHFRLAARLEPRRADIHGNLAISLANVGKLDEAVEEMRKAADLDPANPEIRRLLEQYTAQSRARG